MRQRDAEFSGADLMRLCGLAAGSLYPILYAFERHKLLESKWESERPHDLGRPRRRLYRITPLGIRRATEAGINLAPLINPFPQVAEQ
jgi:DNA-binding PadR family transcriptional regulator